VNLALHVTGRRPDGYHLLDSLVAFADIGDGLEVGPGDGLEVHGPFAAGVPTDGRNLIRRALDAAGMRRAVRLEKRLPHPAGLGGGSSDAACVLRLAGAAPEPAELLALGADVPVCMLGRAARMGGIGERVVPVSLPALPAVLLNPGVPVPTGEAFARLATTANAPMPDPPEGAAPDAILRWLEGTRNDLETPARTIAPPVDEALAALRATGAGLARMTGSGATCFGLYGSRAEAATAAARLARPGWWAMPCVLN
jgi:4-diphosphocytidyl-2-C-methyl-D-erythritol kinase